MKLLSNLDLSKNQIQNAVVQLLSADPGTPTEGQLYYNTVSHKPFIYNGTSFIDMSSSGGTVTTVSVTTANGISGSVATAGTTPAITLSLAAITPTTIVASGNISGLNLSGTNTGDQTTITGNAGSATNIAGGTANQRPYQTGAGATAFYSSANYGVTVAGATGVPQTIAGAAGVLVGSASAIPAFSTAPTLTGTNFTGIPNAGLTNSSLTIGSTSISLGGTVTTFAGLVSVSSTTFVGALTGNASTATSAATLTTPRAINGTNFDGSAAITITAAGSTLTGTSLNGTIVSSSLTSVGTLTSLLVTGNASAADPTISTHLTTKAYVDNLINGVSWKQAVKAASTANLTLSAPQTVDGISLIAGDRVLVKNQSTASQNGIYVVAAGAWTRALDADSAAELDGSAVYIQQGTANGDTAYTETATVVTIGTDTVTYAQFAATGAAAANTLTGTTLASNVVSSSLTSVGTLAALTVTATITGSVSGNAATVTTNANLTGDVTSAGNATTLATVNGNVGTFNGITVNAKGLVTAAAAVAATSYAVSFGNGALTTFTITHNLGTRDVTFSIWETAGSFNQVLADVAATTINTLTITVAVAPTTNQYRIMVKA